MIHVLIWESSGKRMIHFESESSSSLSTFKSSKNMAPEPFHLYSILVPMGPHRDASGGTNERTIFVREKAPEQRKATYRETDRHERATVSLQQAEGRAHTPARWISIVAPRRIDVRRGESLRQTRKMGRRRRQQQESVRLSMGLRDHWCGRVPTVAY